MSATRTSPHPRTGFRPDIEGLRAIAVTMVLAYHAQIELLSGGFIGVDVFFVLSGFLITTSLLTEASGTGRIDLLGFYARRARRLLPAAALVLACTAGAVRWLLPVTMWRDFGGDVVASAAYVVNWRLASRSVDYLAEGVVASPVQHFWSLAIEEQYYLVWPVLMIVAVGVAARRRWPRHVVAGVLLLLVVVVPSMLWSLHLSAQEPARAFFDTGTRLWELGVGALAAVLAPTVARWNLPRARTVLRGAGLLVLVVMAMTTEESVAWPGWAATFVVVPTAVIVLAGGNDTDVVDRVLGQRPFQRFGAWSYSLYLWHWPPLAVLAARWGGLSTAQAVAITLVTVVPAWASYRWVENPLRFRHSLRTSTRRSLAMGGSLSAAGVVAGVAVLLSLPGVTVGGADTATTAARAAGGSVPAGARALPAAPDDGALLGSLGPAPEALAPIPADAAGDRPRTYADGCHVRFPDSDPVVCEYGSPDADVHVAVVGDSKAGQWINAILAVADRHGWRVSNITKSSCALATSLQEHDGRPFDTCREWNARVLTILGDDPPDLVVTSQGAERSYEPASGTAFDSVLLEGMLDAYDQIEALGTPVLLLTDNPHPPIRVAECVAENPDDLGACTFPRSEARSGRDLQLEAARRGGHEVLDTQDFVCPTETCLPVIGDVLVYRGTHLTATYVQSTEHLVEPALVDVLAPSTEPS